MSINIRENVSLKPYCTFKVGGKARYFISVSTKKELLSAFNFAKELFIPYFILGNGSNVLFDDRGYKGLIIQNNINHLSFNERVVEVGSGYNLSKLSHICIDNNISGLEFAYGIPATVGGAVYMNASAHNQEIASLIEKVVFITDENKIEVFRKKDLKFGYRSSSFQKLKGCIYQVTLRMKYSRETNFLKTEYFKKREKTQPLNTLNAGCVFKNPKDHFAAKLIDECDLKGHAIGGATVSLKHSNFIINEKNAKASDILDLISLIKSKVFSKYNILLTEELFYLPYE